MTIKSHELLSPSWRLASRSIFFFFGTTGMGVDSDWRGTDGLVA